MKVTVFPKGGRGYEDALIEQVEDVRFLHFTHWPQADGLLAQCSRVLVVNPDEVVAVILEREGGDTGEACTFATETVVTATTVMAVPETPTARTVVNVTGVPDPFVFTS